MLEVPYKNARATRFGECDIEECPASAAISWVIRPRPSRKCPGNSAWGRLPLVVAPWLGCGRVARAFHPWSISAVQPFRNGLSTPWPACKCSFNPLQPAVVPPWLGWPSCPGELPGPCLPPTTEPRWRPRWPYRLAYLLSGYPLVG